MTRDEARKIVEEMEKRYLDAPYPGKNEESIRFFQDRVNSLKWGVDFNLEGSDVLAWASIFYSTRKWEAYGENVIKMNLLQAIQRVKLRINMAPEDRFDSLS